MNLGAADDLFGTERGSLCLWMEVVAFRATNGSSSLAARGLAGLDAMSSSNSLAMLPLDACSNCGESGSGTEKSKGPDGEKGGGKPSEWASRVDTKRKSGTAVLLTEVPSVQALSSAQLRIS